MFRLTFILVAAIYLVLIVGAGPDHGADIHGADIEVTSSASRSSDPIAPNVSDAGWIATFIASAEASARNAPVIPVSQRQTLTRGSALIADDSGDLVLATASGEVFPIDAVIDPAALIDDTGNVASVAVAALADPAAIDTPQTASAPVSEPPAQIWRVAANAVNFRDGPSTDTTILTSLRRGDEVELLAQASEEWLHLRVVGSGLEGYMASEFLEPAN